MNDFDREMEYELHRVLDPMTAGSIPVRRSMQPGGSMKKLLGGAGAAIGIKILTGIAVAAAATTFAVAASEVAITGSINPANWGQQVKQQVADCKASAARLGVHGIGQCVASFARQNGGSGSDSSAKNGKTKTGVTGNGSPNPHANAPVKTKGHGQGSDKGQGNSAATAGEPTDPAIIFVNHAPIPPQP
jgi:hypothetical protein